MSTVQQYQDILSKIASVVTEVQGIESALGEVDNGSEVDLGAIKSELIQLTAWIEDNIEEIQANQVINDFLASLKTLMTEYAAVFDVVSTQAGVGYGEAYGEGGDAEPMGIKITVMKDGNTASKVFETLSLSEDDIT